MQFSDLIKKYKIINKSGKVNSRFTSCSLPKLTEEELIVYNATLGQSLAEKVYCFSNNISQLPVCKQCKKPLEFNIQIKGYHEYCSNSCRGTGVNMLREMSGAKNLKTLEKMKKTNFEKYGETSYSKTTEFKEKMKDTLRDKSIKKLNSISFSLSTLISYDKVYSKSIWSCNLCKKDFTHIFGYEGFKNAPLCPTCFPIIRGRGKEEAIFNAWIIEEFPAEELITNIRSIIPPKELDEYFPKRALAIEFDEIFFHSEIDPRENIKWKDRMYHANKTIACQDKGITLLHVWNNEWNMKREIVKSIIRTKLGKSQKVLYARKCECKIVETTAARIFLDENHIQGFAKGQYKYGLYYNEELVALLILSYKRNIPTVLELTRFATCKNTRVIGGFSKLWKYFLHQNIPFTIIKSYADLRYFSGNVVKHVGFTLKYKNPPTYFYTKDYRTLYHRRNFSKNRIQKNSNLVYDPNLTEWENMQINGYNRIWDCGQNVWILEK